MSRDALPKPPAKQYSSFSEPLRRPAQPPLSGTPKNAMSIATLNDIFFTAVERNLDRMMLYCAAGKWLPVSSREFGQGVARTARALQAWGIRAGDRIAILR